MGNPLFGVNISKLINDNIGSGVNACTLTKVTRGTRTTGQLTGGTNPTTADFAAKGFVDTLNRNRLEASLVDDADALIQVVGDSIAGGQVPAQGDRVTILGTTYNILGVEVDPALALYSCTCKTE